MARKPAAKPVQAQEQDAAPVYTNNTPGLRMHLGDGRVLEYGESVELTGETLEAFRELGLV